MTICGSAHTDGPVMMMQSEMMHMMWWRERKKEREKGQKRRRQVNNDSSRHTFQAYGHSFPTCPPNPLTYVRMQPFHRHLPIAFVFAGDYIGLSKQIPSSNCNCCRIHGEQDTHQKRTSFYFTKGFEYAFDVFFRDMFVDVCNV